MCGIGGLIDYEQGARALSDVGRHMARTLVPRGPDAGGEYLDDTAPAADCGRPCGRRTAHDFAGWKYYFNL